MFTSYCHVFRIWGNSLALFQGVDRSICSKLCSLQACKRGFSMCWASDLGTTPRAHPRVYSHILACIEASSVRAGLWRGQLRGATRGGVRALPGLVPEEQGQALTSPIPPFKGSLAQFKTRSRFHGKIGHGLIAAFRSTFASP